jgi:tetratricopeptide (TPR) repeat protein
VLGWGGLAAAEFAAWCRDPAHDPPRVPMPPAVAAVLQKCFGDVTQRWPDLAAAAAALSAVYADLRGQPYPRRPPDLAPRAATPKYERYLNDGNVFWQDPCHWLRLAAAWEGLDPESVMPPVPLGRGSRKVQSLADLAANLEADRRFRALLTHRPDRERLTAAAQLALELGWIHEAVGDPPGALPRYDRAIALWEELDEHEGLARALMSKAIALDVLGRGTEALPLFDRAIALLEPAAAAGGDLAKTLAAALLNKANALYYLGRGAEALPLFEQALDHFGRLVEQEGRADLADTLAAAVMNQASVLDSLGRGEEALPLFDRAIALRTRLVEQGGRAELADAVARAQMNKAVTLRRLGRETEALDLFDQVLALRGRLVEQEGLGELRGDLAWTRAYRAETLWGLGRPEEARAELAAALPVLEAEAARTRRADLDRIARWAGQRWQALRPEGQPCAS